MKTYPQLSTRKFAFRAEKNGFDRVNYSWFAIYLEPPTACYSRTVVSVCEEEQTATGSQRQACESGGRCYVRVEEDAVHVLPLADSTVVPQHPLGSDRSQPAAPAAVQGGGVLLLQGPAACCSCHLLLPAHRMRCSCRSITKMGWVP